MLNTGDTEADVTMRFIKADGTTATSAVKVAPLSRYTMNVNSLLTPPGADSGVIVESNLPVVVERPMYFNYSGGFAVGGSVSGGYGL